MDVPPKTSSPLTSSSPVDIPSLCKVADISYPLQEVAERPIPGDSSAPGNTSSSPPTSQTDPTSASHTSCNGTPQLSLSLKRRYFTPVPSDDDFDCSNPLNRKRAKTLLTSISLKRRLEIEDLHAMRLLQLARASRATFAARQKYHRLRLKELEILRLMAMDDCDESDVLLKDGVTQLGEVKYIVNKEGLGFFSRTSGLFPEITSHSDLESINDYDSDRAGGSSDRYSSSPTPSTSSQASGTEPA